MYLYIEAKERKKEILQKECIHTNTDTSKLSWNISFK